MQLEQQRFRYRGWRESRRLVEMAKAVPCDLKTIWSREVANEAAYDADLAPSLDILTLTDVSQIQHLRTQLAFRVRNNS